MIKEIFMWEDAVLKKKYFLAFLRHKRGAFNRGIDFYFTYDEWIKWWEIKLGTDWFTNRGSKKHQYVMAREGDCGPYAVWNVKCLTQSENAKEQFNPKKLTEAQVKAIYRALKMQPMGLRGKLADQYNVSKWTIKAIQRKKVWSRVTDLLD